MCLGTPVGEPPNSGPSAHSEGRSDDQDESDTGGLLMLEPSWRSKAGPL